MYLRNCRNWICTLGHRKVLHFNVVSRNPFRKYVLSNDPVMTQVLQKYFESHGETHNVKKKKVRNQNNFLFWKEHWTQCQESWLWLTLLFSGSVTFSKLPNLSEHQLPNLWGGCPTSLGEGRLNGITNERPFDCVMYNCRDLLLFGKSRLKVCKNHFLL